MATHLTRAELKRDELGEAVGAGVHWAEAHLKTILLGLGVLAGAGLVTWALFAWRGQRSGAANDLLGEAMTVANAQVVATGAKPDDPVQPSFANAAARDARAKGLFERLVKDYGSTDAGAAGHLWLADQAFAAGDRAAARSHWRAYLDVVSSGALAVAAHRDLWMLDRVEGNGETAIGEIRSALEGGGSPVPADVLLWELAESQRAVGHTADARATYQRILDEHSDSPYAGLARRELAGLGTDS